MAEILPSGVKSMRASQLYWREPEGWTKDSEQPEKTDLVLYFGSRAMLAQPAFYDALRARFPRSQLLGCSAGGQIAGYDVTDSIVTVLALSFENTPIRLAETTISDQSKSFAVGANVGARLAAPDLAGVFVLADGVITNGSALVEGVASAVGARVPVSGGFAGDDDPITATLVGSDCPPRSRAVAAVGFYGNAIRFGHGTSASWDAFGPKRRITRSKGNVLFEVDGKPPLDLYKFYLGAEDVLEGSELLFPLRVSDPRHPGDSLIRSVKAPGGEDGSMIFDGDMPQGWTAQLVRGNFSRLSAGAGLAAQHAVGELQAGPNSDVAAILVSCIGRRTLMGQRIDEEVDAVRAELPDNCRQIGFYAHGEIAPKEGSGRAQFHSQTMVVTLMSEKAA